MTELLLNEIKMLENINFGIEYLSNKYLNMLCSIEIATIVKNFSESMIIFHC